MFNNVMELIELMEKGISNEDIINERLKYLNSEEYRSKRKSTQNMYNNFEDKTNVVVFHDGFIPRDMPVGLESDETSNCYTINNVNDVYEYVLNYIRNNKEKIKEQKGIAIKYVGKIIRYYFKAPHQESDKEAIEIYKQEAIKYYKASLNPLEYTDEDINEIAQKNVRNHIGGIVADWRDALKANLFKGSFKDYMLMFLYNKEERSRLNREILAWRESYHDQVEQNIFAGKIVDISEISGYSVAKCTEHAMLTQNVLSFLGYETYMLSGKLEYNNAIEAHNFNVVRKNGKYFIIDTANDVYNKHIEIMDYKNPDELTNFGEYSVTLQNGKIIKYYSEYLNLTKGEQINEDIKKR